MAREEVYFWTHLFSVVFAKLKVNRGRLVNASVCFQGLGLVSLTFARILEHYSNQATTLTLTSKSYKNQISQTDEIGNRSESPVQPYHCYEMTVGWLVRSYLEDVMFFFSSTI